MTTHPLFYLTLWSGLHFVSGLAVALYLSTVIKNRHLLVAIYAFILHSLWEIWQLLITSTPRTTRGYLDLFVDTVLFMLGVVAVITIRK